MPFLGLPRRDPARPHHWQHHPLHLGAGALPRPLGLVALLVALFAALPARAEVPVSASSPTATPLPWDEPFAEDTAALLAAAQALPPSEDGIRVLLEEARIEVDGAHRRTVTHRLVYRLDAEWAVSAWGQTGSSWSPWYQERPRVRARVVAADGRVRHLDPATLVEVPREQALDVLSDSVEVRAPLPGLAVGAVVEEEVVLRESSPLFSAGVQGLHVFRVDLPVDESRWSIEAPESLGLQWRSYGLEGVEPVEERRDGLLRVTVKRVGTAAQDELPPLHAAPGSPTLPQVVYGTGADWEAVGAAYGAVVDRQIEGSDLAAVVAEVAPAGLSRDARIAALTAWLHREVRYTGVELGEAALVPRRPEEVLQRGYGDCKDKSTLLVALLREAGVPANLALLLTGPGPDVDPDLPGLGRFDHAIVRVDADSGGDAETWIDATAPTFPPGLLPPYVRGRRALRADAGAAVLEATPEARESDDRTVVHRDLDLAEFGRGRVVEVSELHGTSAAQLRATLGGLDAEALESWAQAVAESEFGAGAKLDRWQVDALEDLVSPLVVRLEVSAVDGVFTGLVDAAVAMAESEVLEQLPWDLHPVDEEGGEDGDGEIGSANPGSWDLYLPQPGSHEIRGRIVPPRGFRAAPVPEGGEHTFGPAHLDSVFEAEEDGAVSFRFALRTGGPRVAADEVEAAREALKTFLDGEETILVLFEDVVQEHLNAGRLVEGIEEARTLSQAAPEDGVLHMRRALALLAGGLGEAARVEARRAVELAPDSAMVQGFAGFVFLHDVVGRNTVPGWDREAAVAAFRRSLELDPDDLMVRQNLAVALERNAEAVRFGAGADIEAALVEHRVLVDEKGHFDTLTNLLLGLARTGAWEELRRRIKALESRSSVALALELVAVAADEGPEQAVRTTLAWSDSDRRSALAMASLELMRMRRYDLAADLLTAAAAGSGSSGEALRQADLYRRVKPHEELQLDPADPRSIVQALHITVVHGRSERIEPLLERWPLFRSQLSAIEEELEEVRKWMEERLVEGDMTGDVALDLSLAATRFTEEHREGVGTRIRTVSETAAGVEPYELYIAPPKSGETEVRLVALGTAEGPPPALGLEVLRLLEAGELDAARGWLDWVRRDALAGTLDDPLLGDPLALFWAEGQTATPEQVRLAAAALLVGDGVLAEAGVEILEAAVEAAGETVDARERLRLDVALAEGYRHLERWADLAPVAERLALAHPGSTLAWHDHFDALRMLDRPEDLRRSLEARLASRPDDRAALIVRAGLALDEEGVKGFRPWMERLAAAGNGGDSQNTLAWLDLVQGQVDDTTLARAHDGSRNGGAGELHTLAMVYAELDRPLQARDLLHDLVVRQRGEIESHDWLIVGRMAESYGELGAARSAYARVERPEDDRELPLSSWSIAQGRLAGLPPASEGAGPQEVGASRKAGDAEVPR